MSKTWAYGEKRKLAIEIIDANPEKHQGEVVALLCNDVELSRGEALGYYRFLIKRGFTKIVTSVVPDPNSRKKAKPVAKPKVKKVKQTATTTPKPERKFSEQEVDAFRQGLARARARAKAKETAIEEVDLDEDDELVVNEYLSKKYEHEEIFAGNCEELFDNPETV